jgi:hypothetical protein
MSAAVHRNRALTPFVGALRPEVRYCGWYPMFLINLAHAAE